MTLWFHLNNIDKVYLNSNFSEIISRFNKNSMMQLT